MLNQASRVYRVCQANIPSSALIGVLGGVVVGFWSLGSSSGSTCSTSRSEWKSAGIKPQEICVKQKSRANWQQVFKLCVGFD